MQLDCNLTEQVIFDDLLFACGKQVLTLVDFSFQCISELSHGVELPLKQAPHEDNVLQLLRFRLMTLRDEPVS